VSRLPLAFFTASVLCGLTGMVWGAWMASTDIFTLAPAHAHLNLLGWVSLAIMGGFYVLAGPRAPTRLGWANFVLSTAGVAIITPSLAALLSGDKAIVGVVTFGTIVTILGMACFAAAVLSLWRAPKAAA
jgi:hypothetical protein